MNKILVAILFFSSVCLAQEPVTADDALSALHNGIIKKLLDGNKRYIDVSMKACLESTSQARTLLANGQKPYAIILSCSDSRVPPEIIFDKASGEMFVVRVAGNVIDPIVLGSIEYAAEHLKTPLIMILGHERCGAVTAAVESKGKPEGNIGAIISAILPAVSIVKKKATVSSPPELVEAVIDENIFQTEINMKKQSKILSQLVGNGKLKIVKAKFDLDEGKVVLLEDRKDEVQAVSSHTPLQKKIITTKKELKDKKEDVVKPKKKKFVD